MRRTWPCRRGWASAPMAMTMCASPLLKMNSAPSRPSAASAVCCPVRRNPLKRKPMPNSPLRVALAGFGTVGGGLVRVLQENSELIRQRTGRDIHIVKVLVRDVNKPRSVALPEGAVLTSNPDALTDDPSIDVLVELMGGIDAPHALITRALEHGKHIVTAIKALLAENGIGLFQKAAEKGLSLRYEASVAGGIPIIETLKQSLAGNRIESLVGILNGTSNY